VDKTVGDEVSSGTVNQFGAFDMRAAKVGEDSSIQRMIRLVQSADSGKAKIVGLADRWATWVVVIALAASVLTYLATHEILRSVTILVVFCPCAMVLATPTAIMAAIGNAARHGFLVREGDALERLASVRKLAFDKTGTLTAGVPEVAAVECLTSEFSKEDIFRLTACSEMKSEHPLAKAIVAGYKKLHGDEKLLSAPEIFKMLPGQGVSAVMEGHRILAGNVKLMNENHIPVDSAVQKAMVYQKQGCTAIFIAIDEKPAGILALSDTLKTGAASVMDAVRETGVIPVLLTGDNEYAAKTIADKLNIKDVRWNCMPEDKLDYIKKSQQDHKENICMAGDGINDAPALKMAHVGIAMGGIGSDIAIDAADITLINDDIKELPHLLGLSKRMMTVIKLNLTFSMSLNFIAIILAISGVLNPVAGALVHNCGSVVVIINSAFLLKWKHKK
jgi:heavy metal translocating P-type ATPase